MNEIIARRIKALSLTVRRRSLLWAIVITAFSLAIPVSGQLTPIDERSVDELPYESGRLIVTLTNGHAIEGELFEDGERVVIETPQGSRLVMPRDEVDFACKTYDDTYWNKLARIRASDLEGQIELFRWCMRYELHQHASNQIDIISQMRLPASRLENLHRQLYIAQEAGREPLANTPEQSRIASNGTSIPETQMTSPAASGNGFEIRPLPPMNGLASGGSFQPANEITIDGVPGTVQQVGFLEDVRVPDGTIRLMSEPGIDIPDTVQPESTAYRPSTEELDDLTKSLGGDAVAFYKRRIEPVLVRSCFAAGCHNSGADSMPLQRVSRHSSVPRRMSQRNLYNIIRYADPNRPLSSVLLSNAATPHGETGERHNGEFLDRQSKQFQNLAIWLIMVSNNPHGNHQMPLPDDMTAPAMEQAAMLPAPPAFNAEVNTATPPANYVENSPLDAARNFDAEFGSGVGLMDGVTLPGDMESLLTIPGLDPLTPDPATVESGVLPGGTPFTPGATSPPGTALPAGTPDANPHSADIFNQEHRGG